MTQELRESHEEALRRVLNSGEESSQTDSEKPPPKVTAEEPQNKRRPV